MSKTQGERPVLRQLLKTAQLMVQGGLSETTRRQGNRNDICHRDAAHRQGPRLHLAYRSDCALYVPHELPIRAASKASWDGLCLGAEYREQLRNRMRTTGHWITGNRAIESC